jgi:hypothetical protein
LEWSLAKTAHRGLLCFGLYWVAPCYCNRVTTLVCAKPVSQGRETWSDFRVLGTCPAPVGGSADITALYTARFGPPTPARKVYIQANQFIDGWESLPVNFWAIVPAGA